jgi:hypothetical protein
MSSAFKALAACISARAGNWTFLNTTIPTTEKSLLGILGYHDQFVRKVKESLSGGGGSGRGADLHVENNPAITSKSTGITQNKYLFFCMKKSPFSYYTITNPKRQ